ncbi:MAG TPA: site-specific DNA-methyltransferase [Rhizomicrobium sp.]|jgi:adenine-specific DNA-methyltransferase
MNATTRIIEPWHVAKKGQKSVAQLFHTSAEVLLAAQPDNSIDLIVTSPPYCMGMEYDKYTSADDFLREHRAILPEVARVLKLGGSACWQVGHHVKEGVVTPLDILVYVAARDVPELVLRNRIVWTFGHGLHAPNRFSGRHETVMWFTKGADYTFNLDDVRVPQKYPGKRHYKGDKKGQFSGNPLGKNPSDVWGFAEEGDVWDIPNVKARHVEKSQHPCQFPVALPRRLIRALSSSGSLVCDPYLGSGTTAVAAALENRRFVGSDTEKRYLQIARQRIVNLNGGALHIRQDGPPQAPSITHAVAKLPPSWQRLRNSARRTNDGGRKARKT